ncbi:enoyl-CoA hydratase/isomerase family protein [Chelatococcus sp. SYSU_G07232]|uniref:3-hydroxyisobutyryl-CoA hydrolase n=1 Tax=Chelatococcus albus TaxID=3047466 RepID=A0ABT7AD06_9HYPH|nr:enoyl-CoA hydratase/isomerase family protein [Chelatococcus sp. SYSU_G07232]MDJ1156940.1 enoyl-CoA hydratase/isomerase family protein [Chelatococcus sp. SYSU_G07232]
MEAVIEREISCERKGEAGVILLDRPRALNALTLGMVRAMRQALDAWEKDPLVTRVVIMGAGEKAFCAGGDIRKLHDLGKAGHLDEARAFWGEEYQLNTRIKRYSKPFIALVDGICMGGGVGVSLHGSHRVAGDRFLFAMPEVGIGFFPDVGATYALPRLPGETGTYLALTGERLGAADALALGIVTHVVPSAAFPAVLDALVAGEPVDAALAAHASVPEPGPLAAERPIIDSCFAAGSVAGVLAKLDEAAAGGAAFAARVAATMRSKSPTSMAIALEQVRRGKTMDFEEAMRTEYRIVCRIAEGHDFYEGVRAVIVDKDQAPKWRPARVEDVTSEAIAAYFAPLGPDELELP